MSSNNPLRQYFRQPAIYIKLPSGGAFYPEGTLDMPANGELPVLPMTAIDEITYRTPDALYNGSAVVNVIQSCVPSIRNAWAMPATDVDTVLIAIRIASYGHDMDFGTKCPNCEHECEHTVDLRSVLDRMRTPDYNTSIKHGDLEIYFRPMTYKNINDNSQVQFEEQKILQNMADTVGDEDSKIKAISDALNKLTNITVQALSQSIATIKTPSAFVTESEYIEDFLKNCDRNLFDQIRDHIINVRANAEMKPFDLTCPECRHQYKQNITLDMTSFFGPAS